MTVNCSDITAKALKITTIDSGTLINEGLAPPLDMTVYRTNHALGRFSTGTFARDSAGITTFGGGDPLVLAPSTYQTGPSASVTYPRSIATLAGSYATSVDVPSTPISATLCYPETTWTTNTPGARSWYFYDKDGNPYTDLFLLQPAMTGTCAQVIAKGLKASSIEGATGSASIDSSHGIYLYNKGQLKGVIDGQTWNATDNQEPERNYMPLVLVLGGGYGTDVVKVPQVTVNMNYNAGQTLSMCFPGADGAVPAKYAFYYDTAGNPYTDLFLTKAATCNASDATLPTDTEPGIILKKP